MHTKILLRTLTFNSRYQHWIEYERNIHLEMLRGSYANEVFGKGSADLEYEYSPACTRLTWTPDTLGIDALDFMIDYFQQLLLKNNYYTYLSDVRYEIFDTGLKLTVHRHQMKPSLPATVMPDELLIPGFGNLYIEHRYNSRHNSVCVSANYYGKKPERSFENLMELLLG
jgi:hypothetical protein